MTKAAKLHTILHILDWNEDLQELENGPVTAQSIRDFDSEYDWGTVSYGDAVIAYVEAAGVDLATVSVADQGWLAGLVEGMYFKEGAAA